MCNTDYLQSFKTSSLSFSRHCRSYRPIVCSVLFSDLPTLNPAINSDNFDLDRIKPLLNAALADNLKEELDPVYVGLCNFHQTFLEGVADI
jgi:hypothetical protein